MIDAVAVPTLALPPVRPEEARTPRFLCGLDLGQSQDFSALAVAEQGAGPEPAYDVRHAERVPLGTRYPAIVAHTCGIVAALATREPTPRVDLVVDYTGVGRAVADMIVDAAPAATLVLLTIHGGEAVTEPNPKEFRVPKRDLAGAVQVLLQSGRLRIARTLACADALTAELVGFRAKIDLRTGHDSYGAGEDWRSGNPGNHDDLVLALASAVWWGERPPADDQSVLVTANVSGWGYGRAGFRHGRYGR